MPLVLVRLSGVNVLREPGSGEEGEARARERGKAAAAKFKAVPMTPGGCCGGVSPLGSEQVNRELWLVLGMFYLPVQLVGPSKVLVAGRLGCFLAGGRMCRKTWSLTALGRLFRDLGCQGCLPRVILNCLTCLSLSESLS